MKTLLFFFLSLLTSVAGPLQPTIGGKQLIVATNGYGGFLTLTNQLSVGQAGEPGVIELQSTNGTYNASITVEEFGTLALIGESFDDFGVAAIVIGSSNTLASGDIVYFYNGLSLEAYLQGDGSFFAQRLFAEDSPGSDTYGSIQSGELFLNQNTTTNFISLSTITGEMLMVHEGTNTFYVPQNSGYIGNGLLYLSDDPVTPYKAAGGGPGVTNFFDNVFITNLYAGNTYISNLFVTNVTVFTNATFKGHTEFITTNTIITNFYFNNTYITNINQGTGSGTTINPTDGFVPVRANSTTFTNSPLWVGTNALFVKFGSDTVAWVTNSGRFFVTNSLVTGTGGSITTEGYKAGIFENGSAIGTRLIAQTSGSDFIEITPSFFALEDSSTVTNYAFVLGRTDQTFSIGELTGAGANTASARFDQSATAGETRFWVYDVDNGQLEKVTVGAADSGGSGFKLLRIPN